MPAEAQSAFPHDMYLQDLQYESKPMDPKTKLAVATAKFVVKSAGKKIK